MVSQQRVDYNVACGLNTALFLVSFPGLAWVAYKHVTDTTVRSHFEGKFPTADLESESASREGFESEKAPATRITPASPAGP